MRRPVFVAGDLSGIQDYVLGIKAAGKAQAKRLRARSFHVEILENAALIRARRSLRVSQKRDILIAGGGGFLLRSGHAVGSATCEDLHRELQRQVFEESGGELGFSMGWGSTVAEARDHLERGKRRPWESLLSNGNGWSAEAWHRPPISPPCPVCVRLRADTEGREPSACSMCRQATRIGERLTTWRLLRPTAGPEPQSISALGVHFGQAAPSSPDAFQVRREIPRHPSGEPLTFEELAEHSTGAARLAVLKADVDDMGVRVSQIADADDTYRSLRRFSKDLHVFFSERIQEMAESWRQTYTLFAGGDDLLLIGPWDKTLDLAGHFHREFRAGPGKRYPGLTFSAGIALTPYRVPVRHAVRRAEELLESAKNRRGKDRCATLGADWRWERHRDIIANGRMLASAARDRAASRSLLQRLLTLLDGSSAPGLRAARWSYQVGRAERLSDPVKRWAESVAAFLADTDGARADVAESAASLRYALLATRSS